MSSTARRYFEDLYASMPDPWGFETRWYEQRKYALTVAALPEAHYGSAFEPGCSIGVLSALLASRCDQLLATDIVPSALRRASDRVRSPHVRFEERAIPEQWPDELFDLVVLSEIAYYFDAGVLGQLVSLVAGSTLPGGTVVAVHWRGETDYPLSGDAAHEILDSSPLLDRVAHHTETDFVLDLWERAR
ncbi:MAG: Methyltransferase type 12 [Acidimicrobiaceae bacterium]|jgi:trans-aconitate methyltransferase|nr:Methyltransferase type 12 [Acidimicrobiaceae bacterium]